MDTKRTISKDKMLYSIVIDFEKEKRKREERKKGNKLTPRQRTSRK